MQSQKSFFIMVKEQRLKESNYHPINQDCLPTGRDAWLLPIAIGTQWRSLGQSYSEKVLSVSHILNPKVNRTFPALPLTFAP
jgi:hypothetical protein